MSIRNPTLEGVSQQERVAYSQRVDEMRRAVNGTRRSIDEILEQLGAIKESLQNSTADLSLYATANDLEKRIIAQRDRVSGNRTTGEYAVNRPVPITGRLQHAAYDPNRTAHGPTATQRESLRIAQTVYGDVANQLTALIDVEYRALLEAVEAAGVPWTPGRGVLTPN